MTELAVWCAFALALSTMAPVHVPSSPQSPTVPTLPDVGSEILQLVIDDQWDRGNDLFGSRPAKALDWDTIAKRDARRQAAVRALLAGGKIRGGREYEFAALVFQHSGTPDNLALAHVLAMTAVSKGQATAKWLAAATLDRYLQSVKAPQLFGTQFTGGPEASSWTMEPYDRKVLADSVRASWCVVPQAEQDRILRDLQHGTPSNVATNIAECGQSPSQPPSGPDITLNIGQLEREWNEAHLGGDVPAIDRLCADDMVVTVPEMPVMAKADILGFWRSGRARITRYETSDTRVLVHGEAAVVTGRLQRRRDFNGRVVDDDWRFTKTYLRRGDRWQVVAYHASVSAK
jgi:ketosteroid isomerase-like protein